MLSHGRGVCAVRTGAQSKRFWEIGRCTPSDSQPRGAPPDVSPADLFSCPGECHIHTTTIALLKQNGQFLTTRGRCRKQSGPYVLIAKVLTVGESKAGEISGRRITWHLARHRAEHGIKHGGKSCPRVFATSLRPLLCSAFFSPHNNIATMDDSHGPALQLSSSLSIPPPRVSDYCRLLNRSIRAQPYREMFNETFRKLRHYTFQNEEQFTAQCRDLLLAIRCVRRAEREGTDDEENDEGDGDADGDGIDSAFDLEIDLDLPVIEAPMSIREMSRGGGSTPRFADTKIQQWVRQTIAGGNSSLSGNHRPDLCVSVRYRGGSLISLVGEDAIFGRSSKRALNGEQLFQAVPSLPTRSGTSRTARPYDEELGRVWQKKFARIQLYLLSAFEAFGCRLGLLRIHDQYGRLFVQDQHTIIVESSADFLSQDPPLADVSAATLIENAANSRHLPHRWSSRITSLDPMVDIVALAYDLLLMVELAEPLPLLVGPELDEAMPNAHRFNTATHHGVDLYRLLIRDRGQSLLVSEHDSARAFRHIFAGTDWTWDALEPPSSPRTSESDPSDHDGTDRTDGSSAHPGDNPGEDRSTPPNGSDQGRDEGTGQHEDPPSDIPPNDQGSSHGCELFRPAAPLNSSADTRRPCRSWPPADVPRHCSAHVRDSIRATHRVRTSRRRLSKPSSIRCYRCCPDDIGPCS